MRDDYFYNGVRVSQMTTAQILSCLDKGVQINCRMGDARPVEEIEKSIIARLRTELDIRKVRFST